MTQLTLARTENADLLCRLLTDSHTERGLDLTPEARRAALLPLLEGSHHGVAYLIGPVRAPIGFAILGFGWSLTLGGLTGTVDEIYIRPGVRGRGIGSEVLTSLPKALAGAGLVALHVDLGPGDARAERFFTRLRFRAATGAARMTRSL